MIQEILKLLMRHKRFAVEFILACLTLFSLSYGTSMYHKALRASESLEMAKNNIEVYEEKFNISSYANGVLHKQMVDMLHSKDSLIHKLDSVANKSNIKTKNITTAATLKLTLLVTKSKGVRGDIVNILKDTTYTDTINYNDLTKVYYSINKDTVNITIDLQNTQYLYTFKTREYKNNKNFFKRLLTLDFKKVDKYKYKIVNSNDLLKESDIRVITE